jgi:hypothetical protein
MKQLYILMFIGSILSAHAYEQTVSPNGYSGLGVVPSAKTLTGGYVALAHDSTVPGAPITSGYNTQIGFGLMNNLELIGRLATNNQKCNMFKVGECPQDTYRDFSASMKWSLENDWLKKQNTAFAIGVTDFGGAATYFRSYYVVGTKSIRNLDLSVGQAKAQVRTSMLDGAMASATWRLSDWGKVSLQKVGMHTSAHALLQIPITSEGASAWVTYNNRISKYPVMDKNWLGWGVSIPLDRVEKQSKQTQFVQEPETKYTKDLKKINPKDLVSALNGSGFYNPKIGRKKNNTIVFVIENTAYGWNILDAAGVALGVISSALSHDNKEQHFELTITTRGIRQLKITGEAQCVGLWLSKGVACREMQIQSLSQRSLVSVLQVDNLLKELDKTEEHVNWTSGEEWGFRPEVIISPTLVTTIGTEFGSFDGDLGANINLVMPLWAGAVIEKNSVKPLGVGTKQFEQGGLFYGSRLKSGTNRTMFHQLLNLNGLNTQARLSFGTAYTLWDGRQIETSTQSDNGRHKVGLIGGSFKNDTLAANNERSYRLLNYRYANNDQQTSVTELTQGKFWAGDKGYSINQRFWHGDTSLNVYFRRSRMTESQPLVSFAGIQFAIPFTPRENKSLEHIALKGVSQWTYSLETRVLEKENILTGGFGEVPRIGDSLVMTFNRDRNSTRYYDTNLGRMRNAYLNLGDN